MITLASKYVKFNLKSKQKLNTEGKRMMIRSFFEKY